MNTPSAAPQRLLLGGGLFAVLSAVGFSLKAIFVKLSYAAAPVDALTLLAMRMALSLPLFSWLIWLSRKQGGANLTLGLGTRIAFLGMSGYYLASLFDFYGLQYISSSLERLILFTYPALVLVFQAIASRERPTLRTTAALGICYLGLAIAFVHEIGASAGGEQIVLGSLWVFSSAVVFAFYFLGTGIMIQRVGSMRLAGLAGAASSLMVLTHYLVVADLSLVTQFPRAVWIYAGLMAVFSTVLPIYWAALAIEKIGAVSAAAIGNIGPLLTVIASWVILGEPVSPFQIAGLALVLLGVSRVKPRPMIKPLAGDSLSVPRPGSVVDSEPKVDQNDFAEDTAPRTRHLPR